jgi:hypothetical protein
MTPLGLATTSTLEYVNKDVDYSKNMMFPNKNILPVLVPPPRRTIPPIFIKKFEKKFAGR